MILDKHTPGPWTFRGRTVTKSDGFKIRVESPAGAAPEAWERIIDLLECDARLVASAPDLLTALRTLHDNTADYIKRNNLGDPWHNSDMKAARAAIRKATGE